MTEQEAIEYLRIQKPTGNQRYKEPTKKAFDMAVETLEKQIPQKIVYRKQKYGFPYLCPDCEADQVPIDFFMKMAQNQKKSIRGVGIVGRKLRGISEVTYEM